MDRTALYAAIRVPRDGELLRRLLGLLKRFRGSDQVEYAHELSNSGDGVIVREGLGCYAAGSRDRFARMAADMWEDRFDQADYAARCRD